jgi:4-amino-4-deoxy-L-arabinose transferase-like glycosyltransferase
MSTSAARPPTAAAARDAGAADPGSPQSWPLPDWLNERRVVGLLLLAFAVVLGLSMRDESPTTDEPVHLTRGLAYFWGPDASLSYAHPPLGNAWGALPIVLTEPRLAVGEMNGYARGEVWAVTRELFGDHYAARRVWFFEARAMIALASVLLAFYIYRLGVRLFGHAVGVWALVFFVTHTTLIAHGRLMTTDMPVTVAMTIAVGELVTFLNGGSRWHAASAALAVGVSLVTKYTGSLLIPFATLAVVVTAGLRVGRYRGSSVRSALWGAAAFVALSAATSLFVINAAYRFEGTGATADEMLSWSTPVHDDEREYGAAVMQRASLLQKLPRWLPIPLPYTYVFGLSVLRAHDSGGHPTWFFGRSMRNGQPAYFPVMLLIKTPVALLAALACAATVFWRRRGRVSLPAALLATYAVCMLLVAMRAAINIGVRHVLPMVPTMTLLGGLGVVHALRAVHDERLRRRLAAALVASSALGVAVSFPDYLSDFNLLVAGRRGGERISIVGEEWGQDTNRLGRLLHARGIDTVYFSGHSSISRLELSLQHVVSRRLGCPNALPNDAYVAVRARDVARRGERCLRWLTTHTPSFDVDGHVFVYRTGPNEQPF